MRYLFYLLWVGILWTAVLGCDSQGPASIKVSGISWSCDQRPCKVNFTLHNTASQSVTADISIRGSYYMVGLSEERPKKFAGRREFSKTLESGAQKQFEEIIRFTRFPEEVTVEVVRIY